MNLNHFFRSDTESKPVLTIPRLSDLRQDSHRADLRAKIDAQLAAAARQLATANFWRWDRRMLRPAIERWDETQLRFIGLDLHDFCVAVEQHFSVRTDDGVEWRLDRVIGDRIWAAAIQPDVLPIANFEIERAMRQEAEKRKETHAVKR